MPKLQLLNSFRYKNKNDDFNEGLPEIPDFVIRLTLEKLLQMPIREVEKEIEIYSFISNLFCSVFDNYGNNSETPLQETLNMIDLEKHLHNKPTDFLFFNVKNFQFINKEFSNNPKNSCPVFFACNGVILCPYGVDPEKLELKS